jgi:hypothetical protein
LFRSGDFSEDFIDRFGPDKGCRVSVVVFEIFHDGALQFGDAGEDAAPNALAGDLGEEARPC